MGQGYRLALLAAVLIGAAAPPSDAQRVPRRRLPRARPVERLQPSDLTYLGAFRLPERADGAPEEATFEYGAQGVSYRAAGDPSGGADGYSGSLLITGLDTINLVAEVSIPAPAMPVGGSAEGLPVATLVQPFADVTAGLFTALTELPRASLLSLTTAMTGERIHLAWGQHIQDDAATTVPSHAWCLPTLSAPATAGAWWIGEQSLHSVNGYLLEIPEAWAAQHVGGRRVGTGRYRDGGWSGMGPALFAYAPWLSGSPPPPGTRLDETPLLLYESTMTSGAGSTGPAMNGYQHCDEWEGAAFVTTASGRSAVVFVGTKGVGRYCWYGWLDPTGNAMPCVEMDPGGDPMCYNADRSPCDASVVRECDGHVSNRGWWSSEFSAQMVFYDPADLADVAAGVLQPSQPQPYAALDIDDRLLLPDPGVEPDMNGTGVQRRYRIGELGYDRANGRLYLVERFADGARPVIHVWSVE